VDCFLHVTLEETQFIAILNHVIFLKLLFQNFANNKYYKGGFEPKMTKREASLILGVSPTSNKSKVKVKLFGC